MNNNQSNLRLQRQSNGEINHMIQLLDEQIYSDVNSQLQDEELMLISQMKHPFVYKHPQETIFAQRSQATSSIEDISNGDEKVNNINDDETTDEFLFDDQDSNDSLIPLNNNINQFSSFCIDKTNELTIFGDIK